MSAATFPLPLYIPADYRVLLRWCWKITLCKISCFITFAESCYWWNMFKSKRAKQGSKGGRPKDKEIGEDEEEEAERQRVRVAVANTRNQVCLISYCFSFLDYLLWQIQPIRHPPQEQEMSAIQVIKWLPVLAAHLQLQGLAAHLFLPLAHRRQAGGHELPAVCQTNGER